MRENYWSRHAAALAEAYVRSRGQLRFELAHRALQLHMPPGPQRIVDVGGGYGQQAITFARAGHSVVIVDFDPNMLDIARDRVGKESVEVRSRVEFVLGDGLAVSSVGGTEFDVACCHSVIMYEEDPAPMLRNLVTAVRPGGLLSVISISPEASAMRSAMQGRWQEARATLEAGRETGEQYLPASDPSRDEVARILEASGARVAEWYGIGVFAEHYAGPANPDDVAEIYEVEWLAGSRDPYRGIARCFHLIAERGCASHQVPAPPA